jgi:tripartite-type tricarboxylate transporter receptor subunit TctC
MRTIVLLCSLLLPLPAALAQSPAWPTERVRVLVGFAPGGIADIVARLMGQKIADRLGQPVVVDNRAGANGVIGNEMGVRAAPDGHTLLANSLSIAINPGLYKLDYDVVRDLAGITQLGSVEMLMGVYTQLPVKTVADLIALAKAQPGKLNYASFGHGSIAQLAAELFKQATGTNIVHIAYKSTPQAVQETIAGQTQFLFGGIPYMLPHARAGRLNGIAVSTLQRSPFAPDIPTLDEAGVRGFHVPAWFGMWVPAKTPRPIVARIHEVVVKAMNDMRPAIEKQGFKPGGDKPEAFDKFMRSEVEKFSRVIKAANIKPEN